MGSWVCKGTQRSQNSRGQVRSYSESPSTVFVNLRTLSMNYKSKNPPGRRKSLHLKIAKVEKLCSGSFIFTCIIHKMQVKKGSCWHTPPADFSGFDTHTLQIFLELKHLTLHTFYCSKFCPLPLGWNYRDVNNKLQSSYQSQMLKMWLILDNEKHYCLPITLCWHNVEKSVLQADSATCQ